MYAKCTDRVLAGYNKVNKPSHGSGKPVVFCNNNLPHVLNGNQRALWLTHLPTSSSFVRIPLKLEFFHKPGILD